jgi:DNA polymerase III subunit delta
LKVYPERLADHLAGTLAPVYLVTGDEPLQLLECCDAIRAAARAAGFSARDVIDAGQGFDWQTLSHLAGSLSLFAERKILDLRLPGGKPGNDGARVLAAYCDAPPPDTLLLLTLPRLDRQQQASKWFKRIDACGVVVTVWPIAAGQMPRWVEQRLRRAGLVPDADAVQLLCDRIEGNLLAAQQEIDKLLLLFGPGRLDAAQLASAVADSARYDVFELVDTALRGEAGRALRIIDGLRGEGVAAPVVLWALHREARSLAGIAAEAARGLSVEQGVQRARVMPKRVGLVTRAVRHQPAAGWLALLDCCQQADAAIKGRDPRDPWLLLQDIALALAGRTLVPGTR